MSKKPLVLLLGFLLISPLSAGAQLAPPSIPKVPVQTGTSGGSNLTGVDVTAKTNILDSIIETYDRFIGIITEGRTTPTRTGGTGNGTTSGPGVTIPDKPGEGGGDIPTITPHCGNGMWEPDLGEECHYS